MTKNPVIHRPQLPDQPTRHLDKIMQALFGQIAADHGHPERPRIQRAGQPEFLQIHYIAHDSGVTVGVIQ